MVTPRHLLHFRGLRANLRSALFCALLLLGHVLITTMSAIAYDSTSEVASLLASLPRMVVPRLSGLIFITLLWQGFILFEQADARADAVFKIEVQRLKGEQAYLLPKSVGKEGLAGAEGPVEGEGEGEREEEEEDEGVMVFTTTWMEMLLGGVVAGLWTAMLPSLLQLCNILYPALAADLVVLKPIFTVIYLTTVALNLQVMLELARRAARRDLTGRWWMAAVGAWGGRLQLHEQA